MGGEIVDITRRLERAESQINALITRFLPPVLQRMEILEKDNAALRKWMSELVMPDAPTPVPDSEAAPAKKRTRRKITYETLVALRDLISRGHSVKAASESMGIPYSTAHKLANMTPEQCEVMRLQRQEGAQAAPPPIREVAGGPTAAP